MALLSSLEDSKWLCAAYCHVMLVSVIVLQNLACFRGRYTQRGGGGYCVAGVFVAGIDLHQGREWHLFLQSRANRPGDACSLCTR